MEKIMVCPPTRDSIAKEAEECESWVINILHPLDLPPTEWRKHCIYRVPKQLREVNEEAYTPKLLSIGPFHHIHPKDDLKDDMEKYKLNLKDMEKHKLKYLDDFLNRKRTKKIIQVDLLKIIQKKEGDIRRCYSEDCRLESREFVQMILLDAVFIIELFLKDKEKKEDYILSKPWLEDGILHDLILLENQLPFFILEQLYMFATNDNSSSCNHDDEGKPIDQKHKDDLKTEDAPFVRLSRDYFGCYDKDKDKDKEPKSIILDIEPPRPGVLRCFPCFGHPMEVPQLQINDYTETLLRNLMALEQCHYPSRTYICNYVFLLDHLIDDEKDVDLLVQKEVIENLLGSNKKVAELINKLCDHIVVSNSTYFNYIAQKVNDHYEYPLNSTMATLKREYFPNVFRGTATFVGLIVLGFTFWSFLRPFVV